MKDNVYRNAVDHLVFSDNLEQAVLKKAEGKKPRLRLVRLAAIAALLCLLLGTTVFAAEQIGRWNVSLREIGRIRSGIFNAKIMEFTLSDHLQGVEVHQMELKPKGYYHFGEGMIFHPTEGFLRVTEDYGLEKLESSALFARFDKNGKTYELDISYVETEGGIYSNLLNFYPVNNDEILINMTAKGSHSWPVYVNIKTGACRDALPEFTEEDFLPEKLENGYDARICYAEPFKDGMLLSCLISGIQSGNTDSTTLRYWIQEGSGEAVKLDIPKNFTDYIIEDALYFQDPSGICYVMDENFQLQKLDTTVKTTDGLNCGLLTLRSEDGALEIVDVINPAIYFVSDVQVEDHSLWDTTGYNATRNSVDGKIVVTHSYTDYEANNRPLDSIAYLDLTSGELCRMYIDTAHHVQTHGWLDDDRYCVIYEEGLKRYLRVYEFL